MDDPDLWVQSDALADVVCDRPASSSSSKRGVREAHAEMYCEHCGRQVSRLVFNSACTYECALALASRTRSFYDYVHAAIHAQLENSDMSMPVVAPPLPNDTITAEEYWAQASMRLYSADPAMLAFLRDRMKDNSVDCQALDGKRLRR